MDLTTSLLRFVFCASLVFFGDWVDGHPTAPHRTLPHRRACDRQRTKNTKIPRSQVKVLQKHLRFLVNQLRRGAIIPREHTNLIRTHLRTWYVYGPGWAGVM